MSEIPKKIAHLGEVKIDPERTKVEHGVLVFTTEVPPEYHVRALIHKEIVSRMGESSLGGGRVSSKTSSVDHGCLRLILPDGHYTQSQIDEAAGKFLKRVNTLLGKLSDASFAELNVPVDAKRGLSQDSRTEAWTPRDGR